MSPEKFNGISTLAFSNAATQLNNLQSQMQTLRTGVSRGMAFNRNSGTFRGDLFNAVLLAYEGDDWGKFIPKSQAQEENALGFFINGQGSFGDQEATDSQPGFHFSAGGITAGLDYGFTQNLIGGVNLGYTRTASHLGGSGGEVDVDSVSCGIYGTYFERNFYVNAASGLSSNFYDLERDIEFGGLDRKAKSDTSGQEWNLFLGTGYDFQIKQLTTGPTATAKYSRLWIDSFSESGAGSLNLHITD
jgi:outer membrane autotransporter protein